MQLKSTNKVDTNKYKLEIEIGPDAFSAAVDKAAKKGIAKLNIPGFRKGKAPRAVVEKMYGIDMFYEDALNDIYPDTVEAAIAESGLDLAEKKVDFDLESINADGVKFNITVTTKPEITLGEYKGIKTQRPLVEITDEEIAAEIKKLQERNARIITVEGRAAEMGDMTVIDFEGFVDGETFEGGKGEGYSLELGSGQFIPGFEEQIAGHNTGDEFEVTVTFPEEYHAEALAGKPAVFKVKLNELKCREFPELDDEFVKDVSEFDNLDDYKKDLTEKLLNAKNTKADSDVEKQLMDAVIDGISAEIPECMIEAKIDESIQDFAYRLQSQGISMKDYLKYTGMEETAFREGFKETAERQVRLRLALEEIAAREKIEASADEISEKYESLAQMYGVEADKVKAAVPEKEVTGDIVCDKAVTLIKDSSVSA